MAVPAYAAPVTPSGFYIVSVSFSDNGPSYYFRLLDVRKEGRDAIVRYTRVADIDVFCSRRIVQSVEIRVTNTTPGRLVGSNNPCAVEAGALNSAVKKYAQRASIDDVISFGIIAECGSSSVALRLPISESLDMKQLKKRHPEMVRLWGLSSDINSRLFGEKDPFRDRSEEDDLNLQRAGEKQVPDLLSGRYDLGLATAATLDFMRPVSFRTLLQTYRGPISKAEARNGQSGVLLNAEAYQFVHFVPPIHSPLARQARIRGKVQLRLTVDPATGAVVEASVVSGHKLLADNAINAAKQWRFAPGSISATPFNLTIDFDLRCP